MGSTKKLDASGKPKWRVVIDYHKLNELTIDDKYPLPNISDLLDQLGKCKYFTTQPDNCEFLRKEVAYLGQIITQDGVKPNPEKTIEIKNFPVQNDQKTVKSFLGLIGYYRKFINNFAKIAKPLTNLLKKDVPFYWSPECQESFNTFRQILMNEPL